MMSFRHNVPAINITVVGFGQAGTRMADKFAEIKYSDGTPVYNCLALNSNDGDLTGLKYISKANQVSLNLGGLAKNPEKAMTILEENSEVETKLKEFITDRIRPKDDLVLFFAGLGGGTGTSTIVKAIEEFHDFYNKPKIKDELIKIQKNVGNTKFKENLKQYKMDAFKKAQDKFIKLGVVATLPAHHDGPDVLKQVNKFAQRLWESAKNPSKGIAFVTFPDNQHFYKEWKENGKDIAENYRDYANLQIRDLFHDLNTGTKGGGTSVTFDSEDFRRCITEHTGCLVLNKLEKSIDDIHNSDALRDLFMESFKGDTLHGQIPLTYTEEGSIKYNKVHHVGALAVLDFKNKDIGSSFIDEINEEVINYFPLNGNVFSGYLQEKNHFKASVYTVYKTEALPPRLQQGLYEEYLEFKKKQDQVEYASSSIKKIEDDQNEDDFDIDIDLEDMGISDMDEVAATKDEDEIDIDDIDLDDINDYEK
ncbi:cell division protein FtsZ [Salipaludibacillus sp. CF4.18]|uniref:cell division protein FtsZ n=1 Tax=Salipaludibacillus sp. CF4.18 TaxID=3373081 RepID=UPI003EE7A1C4